MLWHSNVSFVKEFVQTEQKLDNMGKYDRQVSEKLWEDAVKEILNDAEGGLITKQNMEDIAKCLEPTKILENHIRKFIISRVPFCDSLFKVTTMFRCSLYSPTFI